MILGIGIDTEDVDRVRLVIDRHGHRFRLAGGALSRAMQMGYRRVHVSMSHTRRTAIAQVILED